MMSEIILLDGASGTCLWEKAEKQIPVWQYNIEEPSIVSQLHREYVEAGSGIILANTFGANALSMKDTPYNVRQIVSAGMELAHEGAGDKAKVALSIGPLTMLLEPYGDLTEADAYEIFDEQISCGVEGKPDLIEIETFMDIELMKIAVRAAARHGLPIFCSMSFEASGRTMMGNSVVDMIQGLEGYPVTAVGLNCSLGPDAAAPLMKDFRAATDLPLLFKPNAGKPVMVDGKVEMQFDIDTYVADTLPVLDAGVTYLGGCCGTTPEYIRRLKAAVEQWEADHAKQH